MNVATLSQIEDHIIQLSLDEQLWLIERITQHIRDSIANRPAIEHQLAEMAADPDIQRELRNIEKEFALAESDGLEAV